MKTGTKAVLLLTVAFALQAAFGRPGACPFAAALLLPMPWAVGPPLLTTDRRWYALSFVVGLIWDALFEPVIGPGAIAWSSASLLAWFYSGIVTDRSPKSWFLLGGVGAITVALVRSLSLFPLGIDLLAGWPWLVVSAALTAVWCGLVGWLTSMNLAQRWRTYRARTLR